MKANPQHKDCPECGKPLDINTPVPTEIVDGKPVEQQMTDPLPDDITFCFECRCVLIFDQDLNIVTPDPATLICILTDPDFQNFISQIDHARANKIHLN